jgi:hypothetical protein
VHIDVARILGWGGTMASAGAQASMGIWGFIPAASRGRAPGGCQGAKPPEAESFLHYAEAQFSLEFCIFSCTVLKLLIDDNCDNCPQ